MSQWTIIITLFSYGSMLQQVQLVYIKNMSRLTKIICSRKIISKNYSSLVSTDNSIFYRNKKQIFKDNYLK